MSVINPTNTSNIAKYGKGIFGKKPKDMSKFNALSLTKPENQKVYIPEGTDLPMASTNRWTNPIDNTQIMPAKKPDINYNNLAYQGSVGAGNFENTNEPNSLYTTGANQNWVTQLADGGRIGYNRGRVVNPGGYQGDEFEDENTLEFMQDQGIPHGEMVEGMSPFDLRVQELVDEGMSWQEAWTIASEEFGQIAEGESDQGIASIV